MNLLGRKNKLLPAVTKPQVVYLVPAKEARRALARRRRAPSKGGVTVVVNQEKHSRWLWIVLIIVIAVAFAYGSGSLKSGTELPDKGGEKITKASVRKRILQVGFQRLTNAEKSFTHEVYMADLTSLYRTLARRQTTAWRRGQQRIVNAIAHAMELVQDAMRQIEADPECDPEPIQRLMDDCHAALRR